MSAKSNEQERRGMLTGGLITLSIGVFFLLVNLDILPSMHETWPIFPIIVGVSLIISAFYKSKKSDNPE